jgi:hypothetical protein
MIERNRRYLTLLNATRPYPTLPPRYSTPHFSTPFLDTLRYCIKLPDATLLNAARRYPTLPPIHAILLLTTPRSCIKLHDSLRHYQTVSVIMRQYPTLPDDTQCNAITLLLCFLWPVQLWTL